MKLFRHNPNIQLRRRRYFVLMWNCDTSPALCLNDYDQKRSSEQRR